MQSSLPVADHGSRGGTRALVALGALAALAACEVPNIPNSPPAIELRWVVPSTSSRIAVSTLLPTGVTILPDSSGFTISVAATTVTRTLGQDCGGCAAANGLVAPKPAFIGAASLSSALPSDVSSATLTGGVLSVLVTNNYTFDPLRPSAAAAAPKGYAVITVSSGGNIIGKDSIDGATTALPAASSLTRSVNLLGAISGASVKVDVSLNSPAGDAVLIDANKTLVVTATPQNLKVASANVTVNGKSISSSSSIDLSSIDQTIVDKIQGGSLLLSVANPFLVGGAISVVLTPAGGAPITKPVTLASTAASTLTITLSQTEIKSLLGKNVTITYTGAVSGSGGAVNVSPKQAVVVTSRLDVNLKVGG